MKLCKMHVNFSLERNEEKINKIDWNRTGNKTTMTTIDSDYKQNDDDDDDGDEEEKVLVKMKM